MAKNRLAENMQMLRHGWKRHQNSGKNLWFHNELDRYLQDNPGLDRRARYCTRADVKSLQPLLDYLRSKGTL